MTKEDNTANNDIQNTTQEKQPLKIVHHEIHKNIDDLRSSRRVVSSCPTSSTSRFNFNLHKHYIIW